jgi:hypothetical protein
MRYLRPELHVQLNSPDAEVSARAEAAIERADEQARQHWERIKPQLPPSVVQFGEEVMLHDAEVLGPAWITGPDHPSGGEVALIAQLIGTLDARHERTLIYLHYLVTAEPTVEVPVPSEVFRRGPAYWLWDEFDLADQGAFTHSILLTDGRVVTIHFRGFDYQIAPLINPSVFENLSAQPGTRVTA